MEEENEITDILNRIKKHLAKGEEIVIEVEGSTPYLQSSWVKNPLSDSDTEALDLYLYQSIREPYFTEIAYGGDGVFTFTVENGELELECEIQIYGENGEVEETNYDTLTFDDE